MKEFSQHLLCLLNSQVLDLFFRHQNIAINQKIVGVMHPRQKKTFPPPCFAAIFAQKRKIEKATTERMGKTLRCKYLLSLLGDGEKSNTVAPHEPTVTMFIHSLT